MQQRRSVALVLILGGLIAILLIAWFLLRTPKKAVQPPPLQHTNIIQPPEPSRKAPQSVSAPPVSENESQAQDALKRQAALFVGRVGSYSSMDGFVGMKSAYVETTEEVQVFLEGERKKLIQEHPVTGVSWGKTVRSLTTRIISPLPLLGRDSAEVSVQAQVITENGVDVAPIISYQEADVQFKKQNGSWVVTRIFWKPFEP